MDPDIRTRTAIEEHWRASESGDTEAEHAIYAEDAILDYPQSGERYRSRAKIPSARLPGGQHSQSRCPAGRSPQPDPWPEAAQPLRVALPAGPARGNGLGSGSAAR